MYLTDTESSNWLVAAKRQRRVLFALMLRGMRTKFFGSGLGYLVAIAWPLTNILILVAIYAIIGRAPPYGDSIALFVATGVLPFQVFSYMTRFMMLTLMKSRPLLAFPEVKVLDMLFAAALLELLSAACVVIAFLVIAWFFGIDAMPRDIVQAACALGVCILLGLGAGLLNGVIALAFPPWFTGISLLTIVLWMSAGVFFVPDAVPLPFRNWLAYHPVLQAIEWMRSAYYEGYGNVVLDRTYVVGFSLIMVFAGLALERALRGHLLAVR